MCFIRSLRPVGRMFETEAEVAKHKARIPQAWKYMRWGE